MGRHVCGGVQMSSEVSGQLSRRVAKELLGEKRGRSVSQMVEDSTGISKDFFHLLLAAAAVALLTRR